MLLCCVLEPLVMNYGVELICFTFFLSVCISYWYFGIDDDAFKVTHHFSWYFCFWITDNIRHFLAVFCNSKIHAESIWGIFFIHYLFYVTSVLQCHFWSHIICLFFFFSFLVVVFFFVRDLVISYCFGSIFFGSNQVSVPYYHLFRFYYFFLFCYM